MIEFDVLTIFPEMFPAFTDTSICARAIAAGHVDIRLHNFRDYTEDKHNRVDDYPFGGGAGMLIAPQSVFDCFDAVKASQTGKRTVNVYMSPSGKPLTPELARELAGFDAVNILCGHYEGIDQRIIDCLIDKEISIGDYVLTGGELPAMVLMDCVMRMVPGVLGNELSSEDESFTDGLLEYPQYTRPAEFRGMSVPEVLLSGHHANITAWQREKAIEKTRLVRPELLKKKIDAEKAALSPHKKSSLQSENTDSAHISTEDFEKVEMRAGTVLEVKENKKSRNPSYIVTVDLGEELGIKKSSAQLTARYTSGELVGRQVICCVNLSPMRIGSVKSEVRILGTDSEQGVIILTPSETVKNGDLVF